MRNAVLSTLLILGIFLLLGILAGFYFISKRPQPTLRTAEVKIGENVFAVEVASTTISRVRGLSGRNGLAENEGMFFIFDELGTNGFWMKDVKFPIDIIWIAGDSPSQISQGEIWEGKVVGFAENAAPEPGVPLWKLKIYYPPELVDRVLEVNAGMVKRLGIKVGDRVKFNAP